MASKKTMLLTISSRSAPIALESLAEIAILCYYNSAVVLREAVRRELYAADDVEMQMSYALAGVGAAVRDDAVAVLSSAETCYLRYAFKNMRDDSAVFGCDIVRRGNVHLRHDEHVARRLRRDVAEREDTLVLVNFI